MGWYRVKREETKEGGRKGRKEGGYGKDRKEKRIL